MKLKSQQTATEARDQATKAINEAQRQASKTVKDARREARRQVIRARVAAAKARAGTRAKASGASTKVVGAAGAAGLAAGYFLDPESGRGRRDRIRELAASLIRRDKSEAAAVKAAPGEPLST